MFQSRFLAALLLLVSLVLAGCSGSDGVTNPNETQRVGPAGGTFNFQGDRVRLVVPAGSLASDTNVSVRAASGFPADTRLIAGTVWNISTENGSSFSTANKATIRIKYQLPLGADPLKLRVFHLTGGVWQELETAVDGSNQIARAQISSTGTYAVFTTGGTGSPDVFRTVLSASQVTGDVTSDASGTARVEVAENQSSIQIRLQTAGLTLANVTSAHIHLGRIGEADQGRAVTLYDQPSGAFSADYSRTITSSDLNTGVVADMAALVTAIREGNAYVDIHTTTHPEGQLRGQLGEAVRLDAELSGGQMVPEVDTTATGNANVTFNEDMTRITVRLNTSGLNNEEVTSATIRLGARGATGPVLFPLYDESQEAFTSSISFFLDEENFTPAGGINTFDEAVAAILGGQTYLNVSTTAHLNGEIRGQVEPPLL